MVLTITPEDAASKWGVSLQGTIRVSGANESDETKVKKAVELADYCARISRQYHFHEKKMTPEIKALALGRVTQDNLDPNTKELVDLYMAYTNRAADQTRMLKELGLSITYIECDGYKYLEPHRLRQF